MRIIYNRKFILSILSILLLSSPQTFSQNKATADRTKSDSARYLKNPVYDREMEMFEIYKTRTADIVMFGNSLTAGAAWNELLGRKDVVVRAIPGDITEGFYARLNTVVNLHPKIVFIMGGLNDIYGWIPVQEIYLNYTGIISNLKSNGIIPVIELTTYAAKTYAKEWGGTPEVNAGRNREIDKLNNMLKDFGQKNNIDVIDLKPFIVDKEGYLNPELTWDGVHFKANAYKIWAREIDNILTKHGL